MTHAIPFDPAPRPSSRALRGERKIGRMIRALWLTALACALGVLAVVLLVREIAPAAAAAPDARSVAAIEPQRRSELEAGSSALAAERRAVEAPAAAPEASAPIRSGAALSRAIHDIGVEIEPPPAFLAGVVEVRVVRDEDGTPVRGARVEVAHDGGSESAETDARGVVEFPNVAAGSALLTAVVAGRAPATGRAPVSERQPRASIELRAFVTRTIPVRLVDPTGAPFRAAEWGIEGRVAQSIGIVLSRTCGAIGQEPTGSDAPSYSARAATSGDEPATWNVVLRGVAGEVCVHALLADTIVGTARLDASATELAVRVDVAAARAALVPVVVRVLDASNEAPIEGALVEFGTTLPRDSASRTGPDGRTRTEHVPVRANAVAIRARGYAPLVLPLASPIPSEVVARLRLPRRISGRVVDRDGAPLAGAFVQAHADGPAHRAPLSAESAADGTFAIVDVPEGKFRVLAGYRGTGTQQPVAVDCTKKDAVGLEVRIESTKAASPAPR